MLSALLLLTALQPASATEVGSTKTLGLGVEGGLPAGFTLKYWLGPKSGLSLHAGLWGIAAMQVRGQYESEFVEFFDLDFGRLGMYWFAGAQTNLVITSTGGLGAGPLGGVGVSLQFHNAPAEVFVETGASVGYWTGGGATGLWISGVGSAGGRWYF